jgi:undecaprenyl-diphosphatase
MDFISQFIKFQLELVSDFGSFHWIPVIAAAVITLFLIYKGFTRSGVLTFLTLLASPMAEVLKEIFKSARPSTIGLNVFLPFDVYGFPSGHTMLYTAFFGFLIYLCLKLKDLPSWLRAAVFIISVYFIALVGISRVALGYHYIKDVAGGYAFGAIYLAALVILDARRKPVSKDQD